MPGLEDAAPVLLIEDDEDARDATAAVLEQDGFLVVALADYEAALGELGRGLVPCAVIVDQSVPGLGLRQFIDALDGTPACAAIPVIVASGAPLDTDIAKRVAHYLVKPYDPDALLRSVAEHCARPVPRP